jgi:chorismate mutase
MKETIDALRIEIANLDRDLVRVLEARHIVVQKIAAAKTALGLPMHDEAQEQRVLDRANALAADDARGTITAVFHALFECARGKR